MGLSVWVHLFGGSWALVNLSLGFLVIGTLNLQERNLDDCYGAFYVVDLIKANGLFICHPYGFEGLGIPSLGSGIKDRGSAIPQTQNPNPKP